MTGIDDARRGDPRRDDPRRRATARLLWVAAKPTIDAPAVQAALAEGADVEWAGTRSLVSRTAPLLWRALDAAGRLDALGSAGEVVGTEHDVRRAQAEVLVPLAVAAAIEPLTGAGLEPVVFKGPAVAGRYPAPGLRPMDDLDVVLPRRQHDQAVAVLRDAGWTVHEREGRHYDTVLLHPAVPGLALELHLDLASWRERSFRLDADQLWELRQPADLAGTPGFGLPAEVELVALAAHAGKPFHHFNRLIWSVDFAVVVGAAHALDWDEVDRRARAAGCSTALAVALCHARRLGAAVPDALLAVRAGRYRRLVIEPLLDEEWPVVDVDRSTGHRLGYALCDSTSRRAALFVGDVGRSGWTRAPQRTAFLVGRGLRRWLRWRRSDRPANGS